MVARRLLNSGQMLTWLGLVWGSMLLIYIVTMPYPQHLAAVSANFTVLLLVV